MASSPARGAPDRPDRSGRLWAGARTQERHLRRLVRHAWHASPFYRTCYEAHGIRAADLDALTARDLPFVTKQMLMERFDEVATDPRIRKAPRAFFESATIAALAGVVADLARDRPPDGLGAATAARADRHSDGAGTSGP